MLLLNVHGGDHGRDLYGKVNMVLNVHRNHKAYKGLTGRTGYGVSVEGGGGEGDYIPIATLSPPE